MDTPPLYIMLCSGDHEKIQMAAMTASVAAVSERPVEVFVSMNAMNVFRKDAAGDRYTGGDFSQIMKERGAPDAIELMQQGKMLGDMKVYACSMSLDVAQIGLDALVGEVFDDVGGLTTFLSEAEKGQLVVF